MLFGGQVRSLEDIDFLEDLGFDLGEVSLKDPDTCRYWLDSGVKNQVNRKLLLVAHAPREGPPNDVDNLWNSCVPAVRETVLTCSSMGIGFLTIHLWIDPRFVKPEVLEQKTSALANIVAYAMEQGVRIGLENLSEKAEDFERVLQSVPRLGITLDVGHGQLLTRVNRSFGIIERLASSIWHVHLHDNRGGTGVKDDLHLPLGLGIVDFPGILEALIKKGYQGSVTFELERKHLQESRKTVRRIIDRINAKMS
jgi:sugar phosphate isomerase/epimerase